MKKIYALSDEMVVTLAAVMDDESNRVDIGGHDV